jgi:hypothetical protein
MYLGYIYKNINVRKGGESGDAEKIYQNVAYIFELIN